MHLAIEERMRYQMLLNVSEVTKVRGEVVVVIHGWHRSSWVRHRLSCHYVAFDRLPDITEATDILQHMMHVDTQILLHLVF